MKTTQTWKICDCFEGLPEIPDKSVDMILTDMPYGVTACSWDNTLKLDCLWTEYRRIIKNKGVIALSASQPFTSILIMSAPDLFRYCWYWEKERGTRVGNANKMPMRIIEEICIFYKELPYYHPVKEPLRKSYTKALPIYKSGACMIANKNVDEDGKRVYKKHTEKTPSNLLRFARDNGCKRFHETQKPLSLFEYLITTYTNEGDTVHDSCLGSGTTLEACMNLNRNCIGFEIDPQWEPIYRKRLKLDNVKLDAYNDHEPK